MNTGVYIYLDFTHLELIAPHHRYVLYSVRASKIFTNLSSNVPHKSVPEKRILTKETKKLCQSVVCKYNGLINRDRIDTRIFPREARAEGPRVARLINQSERRSERSESRANSSEKYIYIHIRKLRYFKDDLMACGSNHNF